MYNSDIFKHRLPLKQEYCLQVQYFAKFYRIYMQTFAVSGRDGGGGCCHIFDR